MAIPVEDNERYSHLIDSDGFKIYYDPDEEDGLLHELYIVIPNRGVTVNVSFHDYYGGVYVSAHQGHHDTHDQDRDQPYMEIHIPDGDKL
jgi:hypothetical protein